MLYVILAIFGIIGFIFSIPVLILLFFLVFKRRILMDASEAMNFSFKKFMDIGDDYVSDKSSGFGDTRGGMTKAEALDILGLDGSVSKVEVNKAYHNLMKSCHPDVGGSRYIAQKVNEARDILLKD